MEWASYNQEIHLLVQIIYNKTAIPAYPIVLSLVLSNGGAQRPHKACMAGYPTPYKYTHTDGNIEREREPYLTRF